ncbi:MAG: ATPase, partial [Candidatus Nanohaloarchaea archaeon]|nr:ATPase [Candidatus Nanohaloarchaea archaeon]
MDKNVLSQCNTQFILRVTNPNDLNAISRSFEGVTSEVKDFITSLPPGTGLLLGKEYPVMTDVRTRRSSHGGEAKELSDDPAESRGRDESAPDAAGGA